MPQYKSESRDDCVNKAIAAYLEAIERGEMPDRDKFLQEHADIAAELRSFLRNASQFQQLAKDVIADSAFVSYTTDWPPEHSASDRNGTAMML